MRLIIKGMKEFIDDLNLAINSILLSIVYFVGVGLTSITAKLVGKHFLENKERQSYWVDLNLKEKQMEEHYKQF